MTKKRTQNRKPSENMPTIAEQVAQRTANATKTSKAPPSVEAKAKKVDPEPVRAVVTEVQTVELSLPISPVEVPRFRLHLDIDFQGPQAEAFRMFAAGLAERGDKLKTGKPCYGINDAARWLVERIEENIGK